MRPIIQKGLFAVLLTAAVAGSGFASPLSSRLLPLVPPGAQIVAGFENHGGSDAHGRLVLATRNNRLDLEDFQSLTGVDSKRVYEEVIEVAASSPGGSLSEHLLLVAGRFDRELIFRSLVLNGARETRFHGERALSIKPLTREQGDMLDTRLMIILDGRLCVFGTPGLVQKALRRYAQHAVPDSILEERLSLLRPDVTSWNIIAGSAANSKNINFAQPDSPWANLQRDADLLMVAVRFGSKVRVDFSIHTSAERGPDFFTRKAGLFTDALMAGPAAVTASQRKLENFSLESNRAQGSLRMSNRQFSSWCDAVFLARVGVTAPATDGD